MSVGGFEEGRASLKKLCPAKQYGLECKCMGTCPVKQGIRIKLDVDRRIFTPIDRASYKWGKNYNKRTSVERVNGRFDESFGFEKHYIRGKKKMEVKIDHIMWFFDFVIYLDKGKLVDLINSVGILVYLLMFLVIFCETGLVVTPFLPGDSLLFAIGAVAVGSGGKLNIFTITIVLMIAAILGDSVNYSIGRVIGPKIFNKEKVRFLKKESLMKTHDFYEKHGGKTIIIARFMPIIRTFAPFVAGMGSMRYIKFITYNIIGGISWVLLFVAAGALFGSIPFVEKNFSLVIYGIVAVTLIPGVVAFVNNKIKSIQ